jgi:two-component system chemotaxis sensor kinase CheA
MPDPQPTPAPRRRVLVVGDDEDLLDLLRGALEAAGYDVEVARQGFLAAPLAARSRPDAILVDLLMPGLDGYEVLSLLRRQPSARRVPVLALTSLGGADADARMRAAGFDAVVRKPVDFPALVGALAGLLP